MAYQVKFDGRRGEVMDGDGMTKYVWNVRDDREWFDAALTLAEREKIIEFIFTHGSEDMFEEYDCFTDEEREAAGDVDVRCPFCGQRQWVRPGGVSDIQSSGCRECLGI